MDNTAACTIAMSFVHSELDDYCNSLLFTCPATQINCLQLGLDASVRAVNKSSKLHNYTPILESIQN